MPPARCATTADFGQRLVEHDPHVVQAGEVGVEFDVEQRAARAGPVGPVRDPADRDAGRSQALGAAGRLDEVADLQFGERRVVLHEADLREQPPRRGPSSAPYSLRTTTGSMVVVVRAGGRLGRRGCGGRARRPRRLPAPRRSATPRCCVSGSPVTGSTKFGIVVSLPPGQRRVGRRRAGRRFAAARGRSSVGRHGRRGRGGRVAASVDLVGGQPRRRRGDAGVVARCRLEVAASASAPR